MNAMIDVSFQIMTHASKLGLPGYAWGDLGKVMGSERALQHMLKRQ
jgi:hypothetical protein